MLFRSRLQFRWSVFLRPSGQSGPKCGSPGACLLYTSYIFPTKQYQGIKIYFDLSLLLQSCGELLKSFSLDLPTLEKSYCLSLIHIYQTIGQRQRAVQPEPNRGQKQQDAEHSDNSLFDSVIGYAGLCQFQVIPAALTCISISCGEKPVKVFCNRYIKFV